MTRSSWRVRDTGIGIQPDEHGAIFDEFYQAAPKPERAAEGTGLGLALAKQFVELHGGRLWVESVPGAGSTFSFTLPTRPTVASASDPALATVAAARLRHPDEWRVDPGRRR